MEVALIVATDRAGIIGKDGDLPWHLPADLAHFKQTTMDKPLIMGRRTHDSIGRALPGRVNIVLSRADDYAPADGCRLARNVDEAIDSVPGADTVMVIGGEAVYAAFLPRAQRIHLTMVDTLVVDGDARFPPLDQEQWVEVARTDVAADEKNAHAMSFRELVRRTP